MLQEVSYSSIKKVENQSDKLMNTFSKINKILLKMEEKTVF